MKLNTIVNNANCSITSSIPKDGGPLSHLINETSADNYEQKDLIIQNEPEIDFADIAYHTFFPKDERLLVAPDTNQQISKPRRLEISNANNYNYHFITENEPAEEERGKIYQSTPLSDTENTLIDYNSEETWERGFVRFIMDDKKWRRRELQQIEWGKQELAEEKRNLEQMMQTIEQRDNELKAKEDKLESIRPLIPSAQELHSAGITFDLVLPYIMLIHEKSVMQACDLKTAAYSVAQTIREYPDVEGLRSVAEKIKQQVANLDALAGQKQAALATVMDLQLKGFSDTEISEWVGLVNMLNKGGLGSQGNGHE